MNRFMQVQVRGAVGECVDATIYREWHMRDLRLLLVAMVTFL